MTMTGKNEDLIRDDMPSYLDIAEFIQFYGTQPDEDLAELWRRIIFNIAVSNTDDHLRNHGFTLTQKGWRLSPAFDLNPSVDKEGLALNIDTENNALDFDLAKSTGMYFRLDNKEMDQIIVGVKAAVSNWKKLATELMEPAFKI
jgi:serine/threonine-protein kinase HipA